MHDDPRRLVRMLEDDDFPRFTITAGLRFAKPCLYVFTGGTGMIARREPIQVNRLPRAIQPRRNSTSMTVGGGRTQAAPLFPLRSTDRASRRMGRLQPNQQRTDHALVNAGRVEHADFTRCEVWTTVATAEKAAAPAENPRSPGKNIKVRGAVDPA